MPVFIVSKFARYGLEDMTEKLPRTPVFGARGGNDLNTKV